jgi:hypothetical protein
MGAIYDTMLEATRELIDLNPQRVTWERYPLKDNGLGVMIPDTTQPPVAMSGVLRISHQSGGISENQVTDRGLTTNKSAYALWLPDLDLRVGDVITGEFGSIQKWTIGTVNQYFSEGTCYKKEAALLRADG